MAKTRRSQSSYAPIGKDWMKYHPYPVFSNYDTYYLKLAKKVSEYFNKPRVGLRDIFTPEMLKEAAILVTCHFEDFVNEIGIWETLTRKNKEIYGYYVPFYDLNDYDPSYLNVQDFAYLLWHHLGKMAQKTLSPYAPFILDAANYCYELFEELMEDAPVNDIYEELLEISPDIYFFELKTRLAWLTFANYLLGLEHNEELVKAFDKMIHDSPSLLTELNPEALIYGMKEDFLYKLNGSWCGLTSPEWLAEVCNASEEVKNDIKELRKRIFGNFLYQGHDEKYYFFEFISSKRVFSIHRESADIDFAHLEEGKTLSLFGIVNWRGEWWLSGSYLRLGDADDRLEEQRLDPQNATFYAWTEEKQQQIGKTTDEMEQAFISYFEKPLVVFSNQKEMSKALQAHHDWWNEQKKIENPDASPDPRLKKYFEENPSSFDEVDFGDHAIGVYFLPKVGAIISPAIPKVITLLKKKQLEREEKLNLFHWFFFDFQPSLAHYIREHYALDNLIFPVKVEDDFIGKYLNVLLTYYNPEESGEPIPTLTLL